MNLLSFADYQNEQNVYVLTKKLSDVGVPKKLFVLTALGIAKSVQHLVPEACKAYSTRCIETTEKFLRGEATEKECRNAADASAGAADASAGAADAAAAYAAFSAAFSAAYAAAYAAGYAARAAADAAADAAANAASAAYYAYYAADAYAYYAAAYAAPAADLFRKYLPWELVCGYQVAGVLNRAEDEEFILQISKNQKLVSYATMILSESSMHKNFKFFIKSYQKISL